MMLVVMVCLLKRHDHAEFALYGRLSGRRRRGRYGRRGVCLLVFAVVEAAVQREVCETPHQVPGGHSVLELGEGGGEGGRGGRTAAAAAGGLHDGRRGAHLTA